MSVKKKVPMRKCVGCGEMKNKKEMIRVLKTRRRNLYWMHPARRTAGVHICAVRGMSGACDKEQGAGASFKQAIPSEVYDELKEEMQTIETR